MSNLISRQAVNTLVDELARAISDERSFLPRGRSTGEIMRDILNLPPVENKGEWIPIEEREPDNVHERVYVTQLVPKSPCKPNGTTVYITRFIDLHEKKKYITAWQPLPEPYKGESKDFPRAEDIAPTIESFKKVLDNRLIREALDEPKGEKVRNK